MEINKQNLDDISHLIFDGYISEDVFLMDTYITLRTLRTDERHQLFQKYKYLGKSYNFLLIIELLSISMVKIGGLKLNDRKKVYNILLKVSSNFITDVYKHYTELEKRVEKAVKFVDFYVESQDSKYYWNLYRINKQGFELYDIRNVNQFQYYWIVVNTFHDSVAEEKREWAKIEYMTNSICAFTNPKAYKKAKSQMNITNKFDQFDTKLGERNKAISRLEGGEDSVEIVDEDEISEGGIRTPYAKVAKNLNRQKHESKTEHAERVNDMMKREVSGEVLDDHDKIVLDYELQIFKEGIYERRKKIEVTRYIKNKRKIATSKNMNELSIFKEEEATIGGDEDIAKFDEELKKKGFYHDGVSYADIALKKIFGQIPRKVKEDIFQKIMKLEIDLEKQAEIFLKDLYKTNNDSGDEEEKQENTPNNKENKQDIVVGLREEPDTFDKKEDPKEEKNAAEKASNMDVVINSGRDLVKEKQKENRAKMERYQNAIDRRNEVLNNLKKDDDDVDKMFFN